MVIPFANCCSEAMVMTDFNSSFNTKLEDDLMK
jgi:hypothetical protein